MTEIFTAKTVDEAKALAAAKFGTDIKAIRFEILDEGKKGFHGIGKTDAKVKATYAPAQAAQPTAKKAPVKAAEAKKTEAPKTAPAPKAPEAPKAEVKAEAAPKAESVPAEEAKVSAPVEAPVQE